MAKYKVKINNKVKEPKKINDNELEIRNFFIILVIVIVLIVGLYFLSNLIVNKRDKNGSSSNVTAGEIDYSKVSVGMILNRPYDEYYVLVYDSEDTNAMYYANIYSKYNDKEDGLKIYFCDLNNPLNSEYVSQDGNGNSNITTVEDFSFGRITLMKIRNGRVISYVDNEEDIAGELK